MPPPEALETLIPRALGGSRRALSRLLTRVESDLAEAEAIVRQIYAATGRAHVVGVTGAPGSGKSTLVNEIARRLRQSEQTVAVLAVDPTSPFSGGAILGDRIRMHALSGDDGAFIRSMATRGSLGGLAAATGAAIKVFDAAGYDVILVETVGAGQAEVDIASAAHTTIVVEAPGMGDEIQTIKAGILEIADILVLNKADRPGKDAAYKALRAMLLLGRQQANGWRGHHGPVSAGSGSADSSAADAATAPAWQVPLCQTIAFDGTGVDQLLAELIRHRRHLETSGAWFEAERRRSQLEIAQLMQRHVLDRLQSQVDPAERAAIIEAVARRELDPYTAARRLIAALMV